MARTDMIDIEVTDVRGVNGDGNLKAFVNVSFAGCIHVKGFSVLMGRNGLFVSMPRKAAKDGRWYEILFVTDETLKETLETEIMDAYLRKIELEREVA